MGDQNIGGRKIWLEREREREERSRKGNFDFCEGAKEERKWTTMERMDGHLTSPRMELHSPYVFVSRPSPLSSCRPLSDFTTTRVAFRRQSHMEMEGQFLVCRPAEGSGGGAGRAVDICFQCKRLLVIVRGGTKNGKTTFRRYFRSGQKIARSLKPLNSAVGAEQLNLMAK